MDLLKIEKEQTWVRIKWKSIKGGRNKETIKKIAKHFATHTAAVEIKQGHKSKEKITAISTVNKMFFI